MHFVNCVSIRVKPGSNQAFEAAFQELSALTRLEPGCITYQLHRSTQDPLEYFLYERYVDESALRFHQATDHFSRIVKGIIPSLLEGREIAQYLPVD
jgi:quinol monooxygenase YgiN